LLDDLVRDLLAQARASGIDAHIAQASFALAGLDTDAEEQAAAACFRAAGWATELRTMNDAIAVLLAGTSEGWGIAAIGGFGINAVGVSADGRRAGYQALGELTGDWGGGSSIGVAALGAAIRGWDRRGPHTVLERRIPELLQAESVALLAEDVFHGRLPQSALLGLTPLVLAEARLGDAVSMSIVDRMAAETADMIAGIVTRLDFEQVEVEIALGGGVLQADDPLLMQGLRTRVKTFAPLAVVRILDVPPVTGAALDALRHLGYGRETEQRDAEQRLRAAMSLG
jgi:N-acetylglucosamine kinase-like BadF-type ATPase